VYPGTTTSSHDSKQHIGMDPPFDPNQSWLLSVKSCLFPAA
jgi:hypothetical protein